jgi:hypothetical protein
MKANTPLPKIKIASPCSARWEEMAGDDQCRFCASCQKHVYNFSQLTTEQIQELVRSREGNVCARIYQRTDGTVLTADCPVGAERAWRRMKVLVCSATAGIALCFGSFFAFGANATKSRTRSLMEEKWDEAVWNIKDFLKLNPPPVVTGKMLLGEVCIPSPKRVTNQVPSLPKTN